MYTLYCSSGSAAMAPHGVFEEFGATDALVRVDSAARKPGHALHLKQGCRRRPAIVPQQTQPA